ncbi:hypothetical protein CR513_14244, partial [Mucuna pruriens]
MLSLRCHHIVVAITLVFLLFRGLLIALYHLLKPVALLSLSNTVVQTDELGVTLVDLDKITYNTPYMEVHRRRQISYASEQWKGFKGFKTQLCSMYL